MKSSLLSLYMSKMKSARQLANACANFKELQRVGERGEKGEENKGRGEGKEKHSLQTMLLGEYNVGPGKKPQQHQEQQTLVHHPT